MVTKTKVYQKNTGEFFPVGEMSLIDAYKTTDGMFFVTELEAYKHETSYLRNMTPTTVVTVEFNDADNIVKNVNGVDINQEVKQYPIAKLIESSCEEIQTISGIYMWYNIFERMAYVGSGVSLKNRVLTFVNKDNTKYAGRKINKVREKYYDSHGLAWVLLVLEENVDEDSLLKRENYYIEKFDTIRHGYNIMHPFIDDNNILSDSKLADAKCSYNSFVNRIKWWGMTPGDTITLEEYAKYYREKSNSTGKGNKYNINSRYLSFRLNCFVNKKNVVEFSDLVFLPRKVIDIIDIGKRAFLDFTDIFPTALIRYRKCDDKYIIVNYTDSTVCFDKPNDAINYRLNELKNECISLMTPEEFGDLYYFLKNCSLETFIDLCYHDAEKLKGFMHNVVNYIGTESEFNNCTPNKKRVAHLATMHYSRLMDNIKAFGLECSETLTFENYLSELIGLSPNSNFGKQDTERYLSFRLSTYLNGKKTIGIEDLVILPYGIAKHLDRIKSWQMRKCAIGCIPDFMEYNAFSKRYTATGLCGTYETMKDALCAYLDNILLKFRVHLGIDKGNGYARCIDYDIDKTYFDKIEHMSREDLVNLCFIKPEQLIKILRED